MKLIEKLSEHITEEIGDACDYIDEALACKEKDRDTADLYCRLAEEELGHMNLLHKRVARVIEAYKAEHGDPPENMQLRYDILHDIHINDANKVKLKIQLYKEG